MSPIYNIIFSVRRKFYLINSYSDFGLAVQMEHPDEEHFTICGTPNYIAPEVASQQAHGPPADLWSVGCLFYSLVTGSMPFEHAGGVRETLQNIVTGEYEIPCGISDDGRKIQNITMSRLYLRHQ